VDDFGRQQVHPRELLNRWIVPLEKRIDYLTLHTGKKIEVPFDQLIVFSTNLEPKDLVDEAFLRRIQNKVRIHNPSPEAFREIFRRDLGPTATPTSPPQETPTPGVGGGGGVGTVEMLFRCNILVLVSAVSSPHYPRTAMLWVVVIV
jgi:hypothetical protein